MHRSDDSPSDRDAERALAVVEATLAGEAVEPEDAELAELALILAGQRPLPSLAFSARLDERAADRFAGTAGTGRPSRQRARRRWLYAPGAVVGLAAAVAVVVVLSAGSSRGPVALPAIGHATSSSSVTSTAAASTSSAGASSAGGPLRAPGPKAALPSSGQAAPASANRGRQVVQSAQLDLSTRPDQVDDVARQVFDVVSAQNGVVETSTVSSDRTASGYAQFQLSVPSANLEPTMAALSQLHGAAVLSRTDSSQDVTGRLGGAGERLADARALRTSLLAQLAAATTSAQVASLQARIRDAEASISSDLATLHSLHHKVDVTQISLVINASTAPGHPVASGGSFTIGRAAHEAGRVLVIAAGVGLIALAVLVPLGLTAGLVMWLAMTIRRRRREQALDLI